METIERINRNIKEAVAAINSCMPTAMEAAENIRKNLKLLDEVNVKPEPQLIQGYTAEQWQEIKEGKYLCEFSGRNESRIEFLHYVGADELFQASDFSEWPNCRPAQIQGVMRPIFVEPVDEDADVVFFDRNGFPVGDGSCISTEGVSYVWKAWHDKIKRRGATKYIEL